MARAFTVEKGMMVGNDRLAAIHATRRHSVVEFNYDAFNAAAQAEHAARMAKEAKETKERLQRELRIKTLKEEYAALAKSWNRKRTDATRAPIIERMLDIEEELETLL